MAVLKTKKESTPVRDPLNKYSVALSGSFAPTFRSKKLEIHQVFLRFLNLNLEQNSAEIVLDNVFSVSLD